MSSLIKPLRKLQDPSAGGLAKTVPFGKELYKTDLSHYYADSLTPKIPEVPAAPTIDDASQQRQVYDRLRKRRGVLANIFGGGTASAPQVGKATLGG